MKKKFNKWMHFSDYSHVTKNIRNAALGRQLRNHHCPGGFSFRDLVAQIGRSMAK